MSVLISSGRVCHRLFYYRRAALVLTINFLILSGATTAYGQSKRQFRQLRDQMVVAEIEAGGITNTHVLQAMRLAPRHEFVHRKYRKIAYRDISIPIGEGQTITAPFVVAFMTEQLDPQPNDRVLEIGTGSGYQAAVLGHIVQEVYSIEIVGSLGRRAAKTLRRLRYENVFTKVGDGFQGWSEHAPFDKVIVTCSPNDVPEPLVRQLKEGGRMIIPVGDHFQQVLYLYEKVKGKLEQKPLEPTFFVPMTGEAEQLQLVRTDSRNPSIANGGFEEVFGDKDSPASWYYVRNGSVKKNTTAPEGERCLSFVKENSEQLAQARQAIGMDGRKVKEIGLSVWVRGEDIVPQFNTRSPQLLRLEFYDVKRRLVGQGTIEMVSGSFDWTQVYRRFRVPRRTHVAVVLIGILDATGTMDLDYLRAGSGRVIP
jgi:protein-L-isoaspartate(D-aspartate) O-methyltransferase|tara:strand:+ start:641 stop:1915 length:1275 start_codon:yes stop_codon:yes gene_type:complete